MNDVFLSVFGINSLSDTLPTFNTHLLLSSAKQRRFLVAIPNALSRTLPKSSTHLPASSAKELQQTITEKFKLTMSGPSVTAPIDSTDAMFDHLVTEERKIGLTIDLHHLEKPLITPINGRLLRANDQYEKAMQRRLARLLSNGPGKERLHWESESFAMNIRTTEAGTKNVRYIAMYVPITEDEMCECWCGRRDYECVRFRKELSMVFIFDRAPIDLAYTKTYLSKRENERVILNHELDGAAGFAWLRANCTMREIGWAWSGANVLDLSAVWLHVHEALIPIAARTAEMCQEERRAARILAAEAQSARRSVLPRVASQERLAALQALIDDAILRICPHGIRIAFINGVIVGCEDCENREDRMSRRGQALVAQDGPDRVISRHSDSPLPPTMGEDDTAVVEALVAADVASRPCLHGHNPGSCEDCGDRF